MNTAEMAINRSVRRIEPISRDPEDQSRALSPFSRLLNTPNIILLGNPGSGKTFTFRAGAAKEEAPFLSVRQFLATAGTAYKGKTLYLDGLDEYRSRVDDKNAVLRVIELLNLARPKCLRLSCRVADWLGETDLSLFRTYFGDDPFAVLSLEQLTREEIGTILREEGIEDGEGFAREAESRGLEGLLGNPQTLVMLAGVVEDGGWPSTKLDLYKKSVRLLLSEPNRERSRDPLGEFSPEELIAPAGAACASILISGVEGVSLMADDDSGDFPSYRTVPFDDHEKLLACLMRRAFVGSEGETVSYVHRTIAEFLAADWLSKGVNEGLPIRRVQSLIGIEAHPAPELRGVHAWLVVLLPEYASILLARDPYGALMYGDAASLSLFDRQSLLRSLETLSEADPWFRSGNWSDSALGALSGPDMVGSFRRILVDPNSGFHLKSLVLDAVRNGPKLPEFRTDLRRMLANANSTFHERMEAVEGLLRVIPDGERDVVEAYRSDLSAGTASARLRAEILSLIYSGHFVPEDVVSVFCDVLSDKDEHVIGELWNVAHSIPDEALCDILDLISDFDLEQFRWSSRPNEPEVGSAVSIILSRVLQSNHSFETKRLWKWLSFSRGCHRYNATAKTESIKNWLRQRPTIVLDLLDIACDELDLDKNRWEFLSNFQEATMHTLSDEDTAKHLIEKLSLKDALYEKDIFLYETCGVLVFRSRPVSLEAFEQFFWAAEGHKELSMVRSALCQSRLGKWHEESSHKKIKYEREQTAKRTKDRANLQQTDELVKSGRHLHNLGILAEVYFGLFVGIDSTLAPVQRLRTEIGDELTASALEGFSAIITRDDLPTPSYVASLNAKSERFAWWYAILAGMDETWEKEKKIDGFSDTLLKSALAMAIEFPTPGKDGIMIRETGRGWARRLFSERPDIVRSVFEDVARTGLKAKSKHIPVLWSLLHVDETKPWRGDLALHLLTDFPLMDAENLQTVVLAAIGDPSCRKDLIELTTLMAHAPFCAKEPQKAVWSTVGFLLNYETFLPPFVKFAKSNKWLIWTLRDIMGEAHGANRTKTIGLSVDQSETVIGLFGSKFNNTYHPDDGWTGSQNSWDAAEFVRNRIDELSTVPDLQSANALGRLLNNDQLSSYRDHLRHAFVAQTAVRREREYKQPSWMDVTRVLRGGAPANTADTQALVLDHLATLKDEIRHSNTDIYKAFWRCDSRGHVDRPEIEDICRDRLIDLLKPRLLPLGIRTEPEGHMAEDKRADIVILPPPGQKLPLELKRDMHEDLWEACVSQLDRLYTRDPEAEGYGIYVVFWFGSQRGGRIPVAPEGITELTSSTGLEIALRSLIPNERRHRLEAVVIDVSPPSST